MFSIVTGKKLGGGFDRKVLVMPNKFKNLGENFFSVSLAAWFWFATFATPKPKRPWEVGNVAQSVEHSTENAGVVGSIPTVTTRTPSAPRRWGFFVLRK